MILESGVYMPLIQETLVKKGNRSVLAALDPVGHLFTSFALAGYESVVNALWKRKYGLSPDASFSNEAAYDSCIPVNILKPKCAKDPSAFTGDIGHLLKERV
ncbi:hypothetical protein BFO01nite_53160 [Brevibacillus formosus]|uniref:Uncharacterized protein n=1 Tax=Brevibacillus formosus TaxID=54913 RepID=A0ABQ0TFG1_9BACL|nr:hypothetical protein BFO01nite_53160 [Brevibacillus formosus]